MAMMDIEEANSSSSSCSSNSNDNDNHAEPLESSTMMILDDASQSTVSNLDNILVISDEEEESSSVSTEDEKQKVNADATMLNEENIRKPICPPWTWLTNGLHGLIIRFVLALSGHAARYPKTYIGCITAFSCIILGVGFFTNFQLELNFEIVATPIDSQPQRHYDWINSQQGFPEDTRQVLLVLHNNGRNVLHKQQTRKLFTAIDTIRETPGYNELCQQGTYVNFDGISTCRILSASGYWGDHNVTLFDKHVKHDRDVRHAMSANQFASGSPVYKDAILGNYEKDPFTKELLSAESYVTIVELPNKDDSDGFERAMLQRLQDLKMSWEEAADDEITEEILHLDLMTLYSYEVEYMRSILTDIYLIPIVALMMIGFTCLIFYRPGDKVQSRSSLGVASVITISMSIMTGNGLMFILGTCT